MVFSPDGRLVAAALLQPKKDGPVGDDRKGLSLIEAASGQEIFHQAIGWFDYAAFTPDGRGVLVSDRKHMYVWDTVTGERLYRMKWPEKIRDRYGEARVCSLAALPGGRVATGMAEGDILVWDLPASTWPAPHPRHQLGREVLTALWSDLAGDAPTAHRAMSVLTAEPVQAVPLLRERLQPMTDDTIRIDKLVADLDSDAFDTREAATSELTRLHYRAEPVLRRALEGRQWPEKRRRLQAILAAPKRPPAEALRILRAIDVLERVGTPEAQRVLEKLAGGADGCETHEAKASLERLKRTPK
jgi:hypothetical protein